MVPVEWPAPACGRARPFLHNVVFLCMVGGFIIHVLLSAFMFPGTMDGMTSGRVSTAWAACHHPRWFREQRDRDLSGERRRDPE